MSRQEQDWDISTGINYIIASKTQLAPVFLSTSQTKSVHHPKSLVMLLWSQLSMPTKQKSNSDKKVDKNGGTIVPRRRERAWKCERDREKERREMAREREREDCSNHDRSGQERMSERLSGIMGKLTLANERAPIRQKQQISIKAPRIPILPLAFLLHSSSTCTNNFLSSCCSGQSRWGNGAKR